jgi:glutamate carboxypeptidase
MRNNILAAALCSAALLTAPAHAALSPAEQKMVSSVDADQERSVALLERLVNQNSGSMNIEGVTAVAKADR